MPNVSKQSSFLKSTKSSSAISNLSKPELSALSKETVRKKLIEVFAGEDLEIQKEKAKGILRVSIGTKKLSLYVKSKRMRVWANVEGIKNEDQYIVFVDYAGKASENDAEFYIVNSREWDSILKRCLSEVRKRSPNKKIEIDPETNTTVFINQKMRESGLPYTGIDVRASLLRPYKDHWEKLKL
jgi:hypothetical protein